MTMTACQAAQCTAFQALQAQAHVPQPMHRQTSHKECGLQLAATLIACFGFNGYDNPRAFVKPCIFCRLSSGGRSPFFSAKKAPQGHAGNDDTPYTESVYTDSIIGCTYGPAPAVGAPVHGCGGASPLALLW